jgi:hypothetical protein
MVAIMFDFIEKNFIWIILSFSVLALWPTVKLAPTSRQVRII